MAHAMTQIDAASRLAALIRRQMAAQPSSTSPIRPGSTSAVDQARPAAADAAAASPGRDIAATVALRVQTIALDDPQRERKAFGMFLHAVLLAEFGDQLINDPGFYQLVDEVHRQMETDPELLEGIREAAKMLLESSAS